MQEGWCQEYSVNPKSNKATVATSEPLGNGIKDCSWLYPEARIEKELSLGVHKTSNTTPEMMVCITLQPGNMEQCLCSQGRCFPIVLYGTIVAECWQSDVRTIHSSLMYDDLWPLADLGCTSVPSGPVTAASSIHLYIRPAPIVQHQVRTTDNCHIPAQIIWPGWPGPVQEYSSHSVTLTIVHGYIDHACSLWSLAATTVIVLISFWSAQSQSVKRMMHAVITQ